MEAKTVIQLFEQLKSDRGVWEDTWQDVCDYCRPIRHNITRSDEKGSQRMAKITDNTATNALERFASGLYGYMCRPDEQWFQLFSSNEAVLADEEALRWFNTVSQLMRANIYASRYAMEINEDFLDLGSIGTSNLYVEKGDSTPLIFKNIDINNYVIEESASGDVDRVIRKMVLKSRQAVQLFGKDNLPDNVVKDYENEKSLDQEFTFYHYVGERQDVDVKAKNFKGMQFESLYIEKDSAMVVKEGGYRTFPYIVARFTKDPDEVYGRSPAITNLADIRMLNSITNTTMKSAEKRVSPPMAVQYGTIMNTPKFEANGITYIRGSMNDRPMPIDTAGDVGLGVDMIKMYENRIKEGFFTDMFDYLVGGQYMTATEVESRKQNKLFLLAPMLSRIQSEKLNAMLIRVHDVLAEEGLFPELPQILKENPSYEIRFTGKMALALKSIETNATQQGLGLMAQIAQYKPDVLDNYDWNEISRGEALNLGMPSRYVRPKKEVEAEREAKAQAQQQAFEMQQAEQGSKVVKNLSGDMGENSPAQAVANQVKGG